MIEQLKLEDLIRENIPLKLDSRGWEICKCAKCGDYKERGGFKFESGMVIYSCFNCSTKCVYEEFGGSISKRFRSILRQFGIDDSEIVKVVNTAFFKEKKEDKVITLEKLKKVSTNTPTIKLPPKSFQIGHNEFIDYQQKLVQYLVDRKIDLDKYPFFFSLEERFMNRIIIPYYRNGNLIFWQARSILPSEKKRYDNAPVAREAIMFNMDLLHQYSPAPLFVTEGVFDAMVINGIALAGSVLNEAKTELLSKTTRRLVFVIDKDKTGKSLAESVLAKGWEIVFSPEGSEDLNESVQRFGLSWTTYQLVQSIPKNNDIARMQINLHCH